MPKVSLFLCGLVSCACYYGRDVEAVTTAFACKFLSDGIVIPVQDFQIVG